MSLNQLNLFVTFFYCFTNDLAVDELNLSFFAHSLSLVNQVILFFLFIHSYFVCLSCILHRKVNKTIANF